MPHSTRVYSYKMFRVSKVIETESGLRGRCRGGEKRNGRDWGGTVDVFLWGEGTALRSDKGDG